MIQWLRYVRHQSAQILVAVAGRAEVDMMAWALCDASKKCRGGWRVHSITPDYYTSEFPKVCQLLEKQRCSAAGPPQFVVLTAGVGEDSITMHVNGLINSGKAMSLSPDGFFLSTG